jgi:hypothetical protein
MLVGVQAVGAGIDGAVVVVVVGGVESHSGCVLCQAPRHT